MTLTRLWLASPERVRKTWRRQGDFIYGKRLALYIWGAARGLRHGLWTQ